MQALEQRSPRKRLVTVSIVIALLAVAWWLLRTDGDAESERGRATASSMPDQLPAPAGASPTALVRSTSTVEPVGKDGGVGVVPTVVAPTTAPLRVHVVDSAGAAVSAAEVLLWPSVAAMAFEEPIVGRTDDGGLCTLAASPTIAIIATKPGVGTSPTFAMPMPHAPMQFGTPETDTKSVVGPDGLTLRLEAGARLSGIVRDERGTPVERARIIAADDEPPADPAKKVELGPRTDMLFGTGKVLLPRVVFSDAAGQFELDYAGDAGGHVFALVGERRTPASFFAIERGDEQRVELRLPGGFSITGSLVGALKDPSLVKVWAYSHEDNVQIGGVVNDDSTFRVELAKPGAYAVFAKAPARVQDGLIDVSVTDAQRDAHADVVMVATSPLSGVVRLRSGEPLSGAMLTLRRAVPKGGSAWAWGGAGLSSAFTAADGSFRFEDVHPLEDTAVDINAYVQPSRFRHLRPDRSPVELVVIRELQGSLAVHVTDANSGAPIESFEYSVPGNCDWRAARNRNGRCDVRIQSPDRELVVMLRADGYAPAMSAPFRFKEAQQIIEMQLGRAGGLVVTVRDEAGRVCEGTVVTLFPEGMLSMWVDNAPLVSTTDAAGLAEFSDLAPGTHWLACRRGAQHLGPIKLIVPSGRSDAREVVLPSGAQATGSISARLSIDPMDGSKFQFTVRPSLLVADYSDLKPGPQPASEDVDTIFDGLPPNVYVLGLVRDDDKDKELCVVVEPGRRSKIVLDP